MQNILIVHGWMHSAKRYQRLKRDLERLGTYHVELYEFPGFGDTPAKYKRAILRSYAADMQGYLDEHLPQPPFQGHHCREHPEGYAHAPQKTALYERKLLGPLWVLSDLGVG